MNILFISLYFPPHYSGAGNSLEKLIKYISPFVSGCRLITLREASSRLDIIQFSECKLDPVFARDPVTATSVKKSQLIKFAIVGSWKSLVCETSKTVYFNGYLKVFLLMIIIARLRGSEVVVKITGDNEDSIEFHRKSFSGKIFLKISGFFICKFITINQKMYADCLGHFGLKAHKLGNIVDYKVPSLRSRPEATNNSTVNFLFLGVLSYRKGFDRLQRLWIRLVNDVDDPINMVLNVVGPPADDVLIHSEFKNMTSVNLVGEVGSDTVKKYLENTDILLFPSRSEGLPNAVIEALVHNICVVGFNVPGVQDLLCDERGFLVEDEEQFYQVTKTLSLSTKLELRNNALLKPWWAKYDLETKAGYKRLLTQE